MKKLILTLVLFLVATLAFSEPLSVQVDQGTGFVDFATPSFQINTLTNIGGYIPVGCKVVYLTVTDGPLLLNCSADIATGTYPVGYLIASGTVNYQITGISTLPGRVLDIWGRPNTTPGTVTIKLCGWK